MRDDILHRLVGLGLLLLAAMALALWVGLPLHQAEEHAASVEIHPIVTIGCGPIVTLGLALLLLGRRAALRNPHTRALTRRGAVLAVVGFAGGGAMFWWLHQQLGLLGY